MKRFISTKHKNGTLASKTLVNGTVRDGSHEEWDPNGRIITKGQFKNNRREGTWTFFDYTHNKVKFYVYREGHSIKYTERLLSTYRRSVRECITALDFIRAALCN